MALQLKNLDGKIKLKRGGFPFDKPVIRFIWAPMRKTKNIKFEFWFVELERELDYLEIECNDVVYEKDVKIPIFEELEENSEETPKIIGYKDGIEKVQIYQFLTKQIKTFEQINQHFDFVDSLPMSANLTTPQKMMLGYHIWAQELLAPIVGIENIVIRLELA